MFTCVGSSGYHLSNCCGPSYDFSCANHMGQKFRCHLIPDKGLLEMFTYITTPVCFVHTCKYLCGSYHSNLGKREANIPWNSNYTWHILRYMVPGRNTLRVVMPCKLVITIGIFLQYIITVDSTVMLYVYLICDNPLIMEPMIYRALYPWYNWMRINDFTRLYFIFKLIFLKWYQPEVEFKNPDGTNVLLV